MLKNSPQRYSHNMLKTAFLKVTKLSSKVKPEQAENNLSRGCRISMKRYYHNKCFQGGRRNNGRNVSVGQRLQHWFTPGRVGCRKIA